MAKRKDKIKGGIADKMSVKDFDKKSLKQGAKVELEHTKDKSIAREIAMDHLAEDKDYYKKLKTIHKSDKEDETFNKPFPLPDFFNDHEGLIPEDHPDYPKAIDHITKEYKNNKNESNRLYDRYIGGGGKYVRNKTFKKASMLEITPDGKQEIVAGKEPLKKEPKQKLSLDPVANYDKVGPKAKTEKQQKEYEERIRMFNERWKKLKKNLNNSSILDLHEQMHEGEGEDQEARPQEQGGDQMNQAPEQDPGQMEQGQQDVADQAAAQDPEQKQQSPEQGADQAEQASEQQEAPTEEDHSQTEQQLMEALKNEGYSDPEIAYIVHGIMAPQTSETESAKADALRAMSDIDVDSKRQNSEAELNHKKRHMDLEHGHAQRMKDLEYEHAKMQSPDPGMDKDHRRRLMEIELQERELDLERKRQEMALEIQFKRKELELKLKLADQAAQKKLQEKSAPQVSKKSGAKDE